MIWSISEQESNVCNPNAVPGVSNRCDLQCFYELVNGSSDFNTSSCEYIYKRQIIEADYTQPYFERIRKFAVAIGLINVFVVLLYIFWFNRNIYSELIEDVLSSNKDVYLLPFNLIKIRGNVGKEPSFEMQGY